MRRAGLLWVAVACLLWLVKPAWAETWYVRPDGGTRYSSNQPTGQCDGRTDAAYPGHGTDQHCAFNDVRLLWQDGSYATSGSAFPVLGWVGKGGDTYLIHGSVATGVEYRVGWSTPAGCVDPRFKEGAARGLCGDPYGSGMPPPPSGTAAQHTRLLGENWQSCHAQGARTALRGGNAVGTVLNLSGASYVDVQCLDISDKADCYNNESCKGKDFATNGIGLSNTSRHDQLIDIRVHGMKTFGILGSTGDGFEMHYVDLVGNGGGGWNADAGDGKTGTGTLLVQNYSILWNGCAEELPVRDKLPYHNCTDQNSGGYGDGFGTATVTSKPGWQVHFDQGEVAYNTQDGLDALHIVGQGSSMTVTRTLAYGNMGQQIKAGGAAGRVLNSLIVGNCRAMSQPIPGTPTGYNARLSLFCRAGDQAVVMTVGRGSTTLFDNNTVYEAGAIGLDVECDGSAGDCDRSSRLDYRNNIFVGFANSPAHGAPDGDGRFPTPVYNNSGASPFTNAGSLYSNNITYRQRRGESCPAGSWEKNAVCGSPGLVDETWHLTGYGNMAPAGPQSKAVGSGLPLPGLTEDFAGHQRPANPARGALEFAGGAAATPLQEPGDPADSPLGAETSATMQGRLPGHPFRLFLVCIASFLAVFGFLVARRAWRSV